MLRHSLLNAIVIIIYRLGIFKNDYGPTLINACQSLNLLTSLITD